MKTQRRLCPLVPAGLRGPLGFYAVLLCYLCFGILTRGLGIFLPCLCTVNFLIANISMNSAPAPPEDRLKKASKKSLTQFSIL